MMVPRATNDVLVIGGGLSGSRFVIELLGRLAAAPSAPHSPRTRIMMADRLGAFGRGVPYGPASQPGFLLIEDVATSTPAEFHEWLRANPAAVLAGTGGQDPALAAWTEQHGEQVRAGDVERLWVPRQVFGSFVEMELRDAVSRSRAAEVTMCRGEAVDLTPHPDGFEVSFADGKRVATRVVVLAVGCIPRRNDHGVGLADGYVNDPYADGFEAMEEQILQHGRPERPVDIVIAGSNASAIETIYHLAHGQGLRSRVRRIDVISSSGDLPGGVFGSSPARLRPSPRNYVDCALRLVEEGVLAMTRARVTDIQRDSRARLRLTARSDTNTLTFGADVVINCTGTGRLGNTDSPLLSRLVGRRGFAPNETDRGFVLREGSYELADVDGCFVIGPLLNRDPIETHVESIRAVYDTAKSLADTVHERLRSPNRIASVKRSA